MLSLQLWQLSVVLSYQAATSASIFMHKHDRT